MMQGPPLLVSFAGNVLLVSELTLMRAPRCFCSLVALGRSRCNIFLYRVMSTFKFEAPRSRVEVL